MCIQSTLYFIVLLCLTGLQTTRKLRTMLKASYLNIGYGGVKIPQRISTLCKDSIGDCKTRRNDVSFVGAQYPRHFPIGSEGPVDMLPEEREFHKNKDEGEEYVWKSNSQIRNLLKQVQVNNSLLKNILHV